MKKIKNFILIFELFFSSNFFACGCCVKNTRANTKLVKSIEKLDVKGVHQALRNGADINLKASPHLSSIFHLVVHHRKIFKPALVDSPAIDDSSFSSLASTPSTPGILREPSPSADERVNQLKGEERIVNVLEALFVKEKRPDLDTIDLTGRTALHWAIEKGYTEIVTFLILKKANPHIRDFNGETAFDLAKQHPDKQYLSYLSQRKKSCVIL